MALDLVHVGRSTPPLRYSYDWHQTVLYALGVGAKADELDFLYEGRGPQVLPTFGVIPTMQVFASLYDQLGGNPLGIVHAGQGLELLRPFAPRGELSTIGTVTGIYDLRRFAEVVMRTETRDASGEAVCRSEWSLLYRFDGGFGGPPPPKRPRLRPPERSADFRVESVTTHEQALLYRLSGDTNPLHADPSIAAAAGFERPILHGLCTYGLVGRAVLQQVCGGDARRLRGLHGQFRKPVLPGDTLIIEGWREGERVILQAATAREADQPVFANAYAEVS